MKKTLYISLLLLATSTLCGCSDSEDKNKPASIPIEKQPEIARIILFETISSDGVTVDKKDTYSFSGNKLETHTTSQQFGAQSLSYEVSVSYSANQAVFTDENGNVATYTLGANGYASKCLYRMGSQTREYDFSYVEDCFLAKINEKIDGEPYSSIQLQYSSGDLKTIEANGQKIICQTGDDINSCNLPCLALYDVYPLSLHIDAIYARLLGMQSVHLVTRIAPEGNEKERTEYTYRLDKQNSPVQIEASTTSTGMVYDKYGQASEVTQTDTRTIHIQIEQTTSL